MPNGVSVQQHKYDQRANSSKPSVKEPWYCPSTAQRRVRYSTRQARLRNSCGPVQEAGHENAHGLKWAEYNRCGYYEQQPGLARWMGPHWTEGHPSCTPSGQVYPMVSGERQRGIFDGHRLQPCEPMHIPPSVGPACLVYLRPWRTTPDQCLGFKGCERS